MVLQWDIQPTLQGWKWMSEHTCACVQKGTTFGLTHLKIFMESQDIQDMYSSKCVSRSYSAYTYTQTEKMQMDVENQIFYTIICRDFSVVCASIQVEVDK